MNPDLLYQLSLTLVPNIGDVQAKILVQHFGNAESIFRAGMGVLEKLEGIGTVRAKSIKGFRDFHLAEEEMRWMDKLKISSLFLTDKDYPRRLLNCYDAPPLLFMKGKVDLNVSRVVAIVGTRSYTEYGKQFTEKLVRDLSAENITVISGLAYGIDMIAHKASLKNGMPTVGVVGHGLDTVYPPDHTDLAKEMIRSGGGLLSEFFTRTKPDKHHFPLRNRIVAGISDATIVVETHFKGGSMITAKLADSYNRDVFAVPGRATDKQSSGCNHLIKHNKAVLLDDAEDLLNLMGWKETKKERSPQRELFIELTPEERQIVQLLQEKETMHIDELNLRSGMSSSTAAAAILNLELQNVVQSLPGKMYRLI